MTPIETRLAVITDLRKEAQLTALDDAVRAIVGNDAATTQTVDDATSCLEERNQRE